MVRKDTQNFNWTHKRKGRTPSLVANPAIRFSSSSKGNGRPGWSMTISGEMMKRLGFRVGDKIEFADEPDLFAFRRYSHNDGYTLSACGSKKADAVGRSVAARIAVSGHAPKGIKAEYGLDSLVFSDGGEAVIIEKMTGCN